MDVSVGRKWRKYYKYLILTLKTLELWILLLPVLMYSANLVPAQLLGTTSLFPHPQYRRVLLILN